MYKIVRESDKDTDLPTEVDLGMPLAQAWDLWVAWKAGKGRFLPEPGALLDQPASVMNVLWMLDGLMDKITLQYQEEKNGQREEPQHSA